MEGKEERTRGGASSPEGHLKRLGPVVLGIDAQSILQEAQGQLILHDPMQHQSNIVLGISQA